MNEQDRSFVTRLFAGAVAFVMVFIVVAIVGGFVMARIMGLSVDVDKFYSIIGNPFLLIVGAVLMTFKGGNDKPDQN